MTIRKISNLLIHVLVFQADSSSILDYYSGYIKTRKTKEVIQKWVLDRRETNS